MLEPQAENPKLLLEHHRRQAALHFDAGDQEAAYWHGRKAQAALAQISRLEQVVEDALFDRLWDHAFEKGDSFTMAAIEATREATQAERIAGEQTDYDFQTIQRHMEPETSQPGGQA